jgi:hypothetical protein
MLASFVEARLVVVGDLEMRRERHVMSEIYERKNTGKRVFGTMRRDSSEEVEGSGTTYQSGGAVWFAMSSFFICSRIQTSDINRVRNDSSNATSAFAGSPGGTWIVFDAIQRSVQSRESKMAVVVKVDGLGVVGEAERRLVYKELPAPKEFSPGGLALRINVGPLCFTPTPPVLSGDCYSTPVLCLGIALA